MAISNMQQARQLRAGGGIMDLEPRQGYFLGKLVKKVTKPLKKVFKSPLGKAALIGGLGYGLGGGFSGAGFQKGTLLGRLGLGKFAGAGAAPGSFRAAQQVGSPNGSIFSRFASKLNPFRPDMSFGQKALIGGGLAATALPFLMGGGEEEEEITDTFDVTPDSIANIRQMSREKDPSLAPFRIADRFAQQNYYLANGGVVGLANGGGAGEQQMMQALQAEYAKYRQQGGTMPFEQFAKLVMQQQQGQQPQMAADGGRMGYRFGELVEKLSYATPGGAGFNLGKMMAKKFKGGPTEEQEVVNEDTQEVVSNPDPLAELNAISLEVFGKPYDQLNEREQESLMNFVSQNPEEEIIDTDQTMVEDRVMANSGGMIDYMSSANPMADSYLMEDTDIVNMYRPSGDRQMAAEGGIMDLGGMEKDYREEGGFVPIGGKEKADDVPARLSKNEFVFTADAVRNAGGGDIDQGSAVMQRMMDHLEQGGEISEESQGMNPAQEMFDTSQQLESRIE